MKNPEKKPEVIIEKGTSQNVGELTKPFTMENSELIRGNTGELTKPFTVENPELIHSNAGGLAKPFTFNKTASQENSEVKKDDAVQCDTKELVKPFTMDITLPQKENKIENIDNAKNPDITESEKLLDTVEKQSEKSGVFEGQREQEKPLTNIDVYHQNVVRMSPLRRLSDNNAKKARQLVRELNIPQEAKKIVEIYIARALEENPQVAELLPKTMEGQYYGKTLMNFSLRLLAVRRRIKDTENGETAMTKYLVEIIVTKLNGRRCLFQEEVDGNKIKGIDWLRKATSSLAHIPATKEEKASYETMVQKCIETEGMPLELEYSNAGWRNIPNLGWRYVYRDGIVGGSDKTIHTVGEKYTMNIKFSEVGKKETFNAAIQMSELCMHKSVSTTLLLYVHASLMATLFELAGYPLCFVYIIQGVTNSRKTSLVTAVGKLFDRDKLVVDAEFATATSCGIEKTASLYKDAPVLIDDFKPGATSGQQREMERKLDELIRLYGNRVAKKRMNDFQPKGNEKFFPVGGGCILTAEILTGVSSTLTRAFVTEVDRDDVQNGLLEFYQDQRWVLPTHAYDFLLWVTEKFEYVIRHIRRRFPILRKQNQFVYQRFGEMFATLCIVSELIAQYSATRGFWTEENRNCFLRDVQQGVFEILHLNQERMFERDKGRMVLEALKEAVESGQIVPVELNERTCAQKKDIYEDQWHYYIRFQNLKWLSDKYIQSINRTSGIFSSDELFMLLENMGVLEIEERNEKRSRSRKLPMQKGNNLRYIWLNKETIRQILE